MLNATLPSTIHHLYRRSPVAPVLPLSPSPGVACNVQNPLDHDVLTKVLRSLVLMCNSESDAMAPVLWAMGTVVYGNGGKCSKFYNELLDANGLLTRYLIVTNPNLETRRVRNFPLLQ